MADFERSISLLTLVTCPTCWNRFPPEEILWVATHSSLIGDARAGAAEYRRFLPTLFTVDGRALDEQGEACQELACPRCHAIVNRGLLEMEPLFLSILGAPSSGKSFYLATMIHSVGAILSKKFHLRFENAAPRANQLSMKQLCLLSGIRVCFLSPWQGHLKFCSPTALLDGYAPRRYSNSATQRIWL
jgi:hypothetical protein